VLPLVLVVPRALGDPPGLVVPPAEWCHWRARAAGWRCCAGGSASGLVLPPRSSRHAGGLAPDGPGQPGSACWAVPGWTAVPPGLALPPGLAGLAWLAGLVARLAGPAGRAGRSPVRLVGRWPGRLASQAATGWAASPGSAGHTGRPARLAG